MMGALKLSESAKQELQSEVKAADSQIGTLTAQLATLQSEHSQLTTKYAGTDASRMSKSVYTFFYGSTYYHNE